MKLRQEQKQVTQVEGANVRVASEAPRYITIGLLMISLLLFALWLYTGLIVHIVLITVGVLLMGAAIVWFTIWLIMTMLQQWYEVQQAKFATHFYAHNESIIGDNSTHGYRHFHPSIVDATKDEGLEIEAPQQDTYDQRNDRQVYNWHVKEGLTWNDIVGKYDPQLGYTVSKVRSAKARHVYRLENNLTQDY